MKKFELIEMLNNMYKTLMEQKHFNLAEEIYKIKVSLVLCIPEEFKTLSEKDLLILAHTQAVREWARADNDKEWLNKINEIMARIKVIDTL